MKIVLASASPRRKQLLEGAGYEVTCIVSGAEEIEDHSFSPTDLALTNATRKAERVAKHTPREIVIAADTVVWKEGRFFGKPSDTEDAFRMLKELAGHTHEVVTGVVVCFPGGETKAFAESSLVTFHSLDDEGIRLYLDAIHPLDKAGAYAAQDDNGRIIKKIAGSVTNVIGLPLERLEGVLRRAR
ncbi:MAG: Maf family protein [Terrimicrobiaceae bacterium]